uniref:Predicted protein n=1 Tax=Hordeum vulgare subsp. vulgare TaxID=112509 RepID=F2EIR9_HORVV|nr:predicted protein [Hordeum vulgare subsp. vulgare]
MAVSRTAMSVSFLVAVVVAAASVPAATAQAPCDSVCRLKAATETFAAAPPTEKAAAVEILSNKTEGAVSSAESAHQAAGLATRCLDDCNKLCGSGTRDLACSTRCETICRVEVESLSFAADVYRERARGPNRPSLMRDGRWRVHSPSVSRPPARDPPVPSAPL